MERQGNIINFSEAEHGEFDVPLRTSPEDAMEIAENYRAAAIRLQSRVNAELETNPTNKKTRGELREGAERARRLMSFTFQIDQLCIPEIMSKMVPPSMGPTESN